MKNFLITLMLFVFIATFAMAEDNPPVYDVLKPMKITASAKMTKNQVAKAKNDAMYNCKVKMLKSAVNSFVSSKDANKFAKNIQFGIYAKPDSYLSNYEIVPNSEIKGKNDYTIAIRAKANISAIYDYLKTIDGINIIEPEYIVKISGFDEILDGETVSAFEKEIINHTNKYGFKGRTFIGKEMVQNIKSTGNYYENILDEATENNIKLFLAIEPRTSNRTSVLGNITFSSDNAASVNLSILGVDTTNGNVTDKMTGLVGSHQNIFTSKKNETEHALKKCLNNLYDFHLEELKAFILNAWVDVCNK